MSPSKKEHWLVAFHEEFPPEFEQFSEAVRTQTYLAIELLSIFGP